VVKGHDDCLVLSHCKVLGQHRQEFVNPGRLARKFASAAPARMATARQ
jgi:hypothetical protein